MDTTTADGTSVTVDLPPTFYLDHVARDLPAGRVVKELVKKVRVELDQAGYDDLLDDAEHYCSDYTDWELQGLVASARATVAALRKVERPATAGPVVIPEPRKPWPVTTIGLGR